jgi:PAS domain S-box-containing protein
MKPPRASAPTGSPDAPRADRLFGALGATYWILSPDLERVLEVAPSYETVWGLPAADILRDPLDFFRAIHPEDRESVRALLPLQRTGQFRARYRVVEGGGETRWVLDRSVLLRDSAGGVEYVARFIEDLVPPMAAEDELRRTEQALRESEARYRRLSEAAFEGIAVHRNGVIVDANEAIARMFGVAPDEVLGRPALDFVAPESRELVGEAIRTGRDGPYRAVGRRSDGSDFPVEVRARSASHDGEPVRIFAVRDLSEQYAVEETLEYTAAMLSDAERIGKLGTFEYDPPSDRLVWSEGLSELFGLGPGGGPATETEFLEWVHPDDRPKVERGIRRAIDGGEAVEFEERVRHPDGRYLTLRSLVAPVTGPDGTLRLVGICKDLTGLREEQRQGESKRVLLETLAGAAPRLKAAGLRPRAVLDELTSLVCERLAECCVVTLLGTKSVRLQVAAAAHREPSENERLRGFLTEHLLDPDGAITRQVLRTGRAFATPDVLEDPAARLLNRQYRSYLETLPPRTLMMVPLRGRAGTIGTVVATRPKEEGSFSDGDLHFLEALAEMAGLELESARLFEEASGASDAKSRFLALASHELRTPLSVVLGYLDLLMMEADDAVPAGIRTELDRIYEAARQLTGIVERILAFASRDTRRDTVEPTSFDAWRIVRQCADEAAERAEEAGLSFEATIPANAARVSSDPERLSELLREILDNSISFTSEGQVRLRAAAEPDHIRIDVEDTGPGIPPEVGGKVFDPFWQAEHPLTRSSQGMGLGLALARRVADALGATLTHEPGDEGGARFTILLPREAGWIAGRAPAA